ncbi:unnamed protein product [Withania somnifera]
MFSDEELRDMRVLKRGDGYLEVMCGCTSPNLGDYCAQFRVFTSGELEITCKCLPGCSEAKITPATFEKHAGKGSSRKWRNNIWIIVDDKKVPVVKTALLKYYNQTLKHTNRSPNSCHRDEFIICTKCKKERRFRRRSQVECKIYHDALTNTHWNCSDFPYGKFSCDEEERASRLVIGCTSCVCSGCEVCRFADCSCQTCIDFTKNQKA